jgi:hypothetical protein
MKRLVPVVLLAAAVAAWPGNAATTTPTKPLTITVLVGKRGVPGGPVRKTIAKGKRVVLVVRISGLPVAGVHLHGYDIERAPRKGVVRIAFTARLKGIFEVELHLRNGAELLAAVLTVR